MSPEHKNLPDWTHGERQTDLGWIQAHADLFWTVATDSSQVDGRGAIFVDTTFQFEDKGHPFGYISQELVEEYNDADISRFVREYDPAEEFVVVLLKLGERTSAYRIRLQPRNYRQNGKVR